MNTTHQTHTRHESGEDKEFTFWGPSNTIASENDCDQSQANEASFGETHQRKNFKLEHSPFSSKFSDPSRIKDIEEGQMKLMEMIQDMPECGYELSFQDMVVVEKHAVEPEQQQQQPQQSETFLDNTHMQSSGNKTQYKRLNRKKKSKGNSGRPGQIMRVESMDSETFLLKLFFPISLDWMKKDKLKNGTKVSPRPPLQESMQQAVKEWRIKRFFLSGDNREDSISRNNGGRSNNHINRHVDRSLSFSHCCWPSLPSVKSKTKNLGG